jgi:hypothetical protein
MKNILALLLLLLSALPLSAPAVRIAAAWRVGEQMDYIVVEQEYTVDADGRETLAASSVGALRLEVRAASARGYQVAIHDEDSTLLVNTDRRGRFLGAESPANPRLEEYASRLLYFHGRRLSPAKEYIEKNGEGLQSKFRIDSELTDEYSVVLRMESSGDTPKEYVTEEIELRTGWPVQWVLDRYDGSHFIREIFPEDKIGGE